jgi:hypothetical protein
MKEEQLREDQRREALARRDEPHAEETMPPPVQVQQPAPEMREPESRQPEARQPEARQPEPMHAEPVTAEPARPSPVRHEPQPPKIDPKVLLESAGLVMIETDRSKAPVVSAPVEEPLHLGRPRRERSKPPAQEDELQQVETKR